MRSQSFFSFRKLKNRRANKRNFFPRPSIGSRFKSTEYLCCAYFKESSCEPNTCCGRPCQCFPRLQRLLTLEPKVYQRLGNFSYMLITIVDKNLLRFSNEFSPIAMLTISSGLGHTNKPLEMVITDMSEIDNIIIS